MDCSTEILGYPSPVPFYASPTARNGLAQPLVCPIPDLVVALLLFVVTSHHVELEVGADRSGLFRVRSP